MGRTPHLTLAASQCSPAAAAGQWWHCSAGPLHPTLLSLHPRCAWCPSEFPAAQSQVLSAPMLCTPYTPPIAATATPHCAVSHKHPKVPRCWVTHCAVLPTLPQQATLHQLTTSRRCVPALCKPCLEHSTRQLIRLLPNAQMLNANTVNPEPNSPDRHHAL